MRWRKINRVLHRDLGYFFFGMTIIYAVSGVALNHRHQWNPNYIISHEEFTTTIDIPADQIDENYVVSKLGDLDIDANYRTHLVAGDNLRIFVEGGSVNINMVEGTGNYEIIRKRPVFHQLNYLHYNNPKGLWTWLSDIYAGGLFILAITGLFVLRGKNGITGRGAWLTGAGIVIPLLYLYFYL